VARDGDRVVPLLTVAIWPTAAASTPMPLPLLPLHEPGDHAPDVDALDDAVVVAAEAALHLLGVQTLLDHPPCFARVAQAPSASVRRGYGVCPARHGRRHRL
jgi:hypothetical protein